MKSQEYHRLNEDQRDILDRHLSSYPVKLGSLCQEFGIKTYVSSANIALSGQIVKEDGIYVIRVNRSQARYRQRFTIAHELSHFLLHKEMIDTLPNGIIENVLYRFEEIPERMDLEANALAFDILMPMEHIEKLLKDKFNGEINSESIEIMSIHFQVNENVMTKRLSQLKKQQNTITTPQ